MSFYSAELPYRSDAAHYYAALADLPWAVWLDSSGMARYDILTAAPHHTLVLSEEITQSDPFAMIRGELGEQIAPIENVPFAGGALGYWSYDLARRMYTLPGVADDPKLLPDVVPDMAIGIYDWALVLDHQQQTARLVSYRRFAETTELLPQILHRLQNYPQLPQDTFRVQGKITSNFTPDSYASAFAAVQDYLQAGDCYQINLAQRFSAMRLAGTLPARAERQRGNQTNQRHPTPWRRCATRSPACRRVAQPPQGPRGKPDDRGLAAQRPRQKLHAGLGARAEVV